MGKFNSDDHYIYYCGQESLRRKGVVLIFSERVWNAVLGCNLKNDRMFCFQGKPFSITVIQVYAPTTNAKEAEVERYFEDLQDLLQLTPKKRHHFHHSGLECKSWCLKDPLFDCGDGFVGIPTFHNLSNCILNMCILFPSILPQ